MPLLEDIPLAADRHFNRTAARLLAQATPKLPPQPLLQRPQHLARISPQPDRLVAVRTARVPLLEAARPLLMALARVPARLDAADHDVFLPTLVREVQAFQSIGQDARLRDDDVLVASYLLCAALDETIGRAPWAQGDGAGQRAWEGRLSVAVHRANNGGEGFFLLLGGLTIKPDRHLDLLELVLLLLALGFEGVYGQRDRSGMALADIRHKVHSMLHTRRPADPSPRSRAIEGLLQWRSLDEVLASITLEELFS